MSSDSSHEFGEFMSAVIYITIFALTIGIAYTMVKDTIKISGDYDVERYFILNAFSSSLYNMTYYNGRYYIPYEELTACLSSQDTIKRCIGISPSQQYYVALKLPQKKEIEIGSKDNKNTYVFLIPVKMDNQILVASLEVGVR